MKNNIKRIFAVRDGSFTRSEEAQRLYRAYLDAERAFYGKLKESLPALAAEYEQVQNLSSELAFEDVADRFAEGFSAGLKMGMEAFADL